MFRFIRWRAALLLSGLVATPAFSASVLQCVPYARIVSGVAIYGDALNWWDQAQDHYKRGHAPKKGAVLAFRPVGPMTLGHVAVVSKLLDDRRVLIRHANWSAPGAIEEDVLAIDVSEGGDWSQVRVWHSPTGQMGARTNPTYGFIYPDKPKLHKFEADPALGNSVRFAAVADDQWDDLAVPATAKAPHAAPVPAASRSPILAKAAVRARSSRQSTSGASVATDPFIVEYADNRPTRRSLGDIIADVKRDARLR